MANSEETKPVEREAFEKGVAESRKLNPTCGCQKRGNRQFNCSYHEGADDAWPESWQASAAAARERAAALAEEVAKEVGGDFSKSHQLNIGLNTFIVRLRALKGSR